MSSQTKPITIYTYALLCQEHLKELLVIYPNAKLEAIGMEERGHPCEICNHRPAIVKVYTMAEIKAVRTSDKE